MKATWRLADGREISADVREGMSLMEAAVAIGVPRVVGECGGEPFVRDLPCGGGGRMGGPYRNARRLRGRDA